MTATARFLSSRATAIAFRGSLTNLRKRPLEYRKDPRLAAKLELPPAYGRGASGPLDWETLLRGFEKPISETVVMQGTWLGKAPQFVARGLTGAQFMAQLEQTAKARWEKVGRVWVLTPLSVIARDRRKREPQ